MGFCDSSRGVQTHFAYSKHAGAWATMSSTRRGRKDNSIAQALQGLTDGLYEMFSNRLDLVRFEMVDEARQATRRATAVAVASGVLAVGYLLLNVTIVLCVGALFEALWTMALTTAILSVGHLIAGAIALRRTVATMREHRFELEMTKGEFERDKAWLKEIRSTTEVTQSVALDSPSD